MIVSTCLSSGGSRKGHFSEVPPLPSDQRRQEARGRHHRSSGTSHHLRWRCEISSAVKCRMMSDTHFKHQLLPVEHVWRPRRSDKVSHVQHDNDCKPVSIQACVCSAMLLKMSYGDAASSSSSRSLHRSCSVKIQGWRAPQGHSSVKLAPVCVVASHCGVNSAAYCTERCWSAVPSPEYTHTHLSDNKHSLWLYLT